MTYGAIREAPGIDIVVDQQLRARLIVNAARPLRIEHGIPWPQIGRWIAMTVQTPLHGERRDARGQRHFVDRAMTGGAADTFGDVNAMVEINKVRQFVQSLPAQESRRAKASMSGLSAA